MYWTARKPMKLGYPPGPGTIAQMIFGISESLGTTLGPGEEGRGDQTRGGGGDGGAGGRGTPVGHVAAGMPSSKKRGAGRSSCWDTFFALFFLK